MGYLQTLLRLFSVFSNIKTVLKQIKNGPSNIFCLDSNSRPIGHGSAPITTKPSLGLGVLMGNNFLNDLRKLREYIEFYIETANHVRLSNR